MSSPQPAKRKLVRPRVAPKEPITIPTAKRPRLNDTPHPADSSNTQPRTSSFNAINTSSRDQSASRAMANKLSRPETNANKSILALDFGSSYSAAVVLDEHNRLIAINNYRGAPYGVGGRAEDIAEVPAVVSVNKGTENINYVHGYEAFLTPKSLITNIKGFLGSEDRPFPEAMDRAMKLLSKVNRGQPTPLKPDDVVQETLKWYYEHIQKWLSDRSINFPKIVVASHPVHWSAESAVKYRTMLETAGFENVEMVNEAEAAAHAMALDKPDEWFDKPRKISVKDLGGGSFDFATYVVRKQKGMVIMKELMACSGGEGGMALVDELVKSTIAEKLHMESQSISDEALAKYVQAFSLAKRAYNPAVKRNLTFGFPEIELTGQEMYFLFEAALQPILDAIHEEKEELRRHEVEEVFLVGGTSTSMDWFGPPLLEALGQDMKIIRSTRSQSTLIAHGAALAGRYDRITKRINNLNIGHVVTHEMSDNFSDAEVWGNSVLMRDHCRIIEVVEIINTKGALFPTKLSETSWHWLTIEDDNPAKADFKKQIEGTQLRCFATDHKVHVLQRPDFHDIAPLSDFNLSIEARSVFSKDDVDDIMAQYDRSRFRWTYAIKFLNDGLGLRLFVGWRPDFTKGEGDDGGGGKMTVKDLGRVCLIIKPV